MKKTATITIKLDVDYPNISTKYQKKIGKDFNSWLTEWAENLDESWTPLPMLFEPMPDGAEGVSFDGTMNIKIKSDNEIIYDEQFSKKVKGDFDD